MYYRLRSRLFILLTFFCIGCNIESTQPDHFEIYKWRAISLHNEYLGDRDTAFVSDTLVRKQPTNIDSTFPRSDLYKLPSDFKIESTDTIMTSSGIELIAYHNMVSERWYHNSYGLVWSVHPHSRGRGIWSFELFEVISFQNGIKNVINTDSLIHSIQNYRYQKLEEMEKELGY